MRVLVGAGLVVLVVGVVAGTVAFLHPQGLKGALGGKGPGAASGAPHPLAVQSAPSSAQRPSPATSGNASTELAHAEKAYDAGDFGLAATHYMVASAVAANAPDRERADRGLRKSVLGDALVSEARVPDLPKDADAEYRRRVAEAEARPTEEAFFELLRFAAAARLRTRLPYLAEQSIDLCHPGGPVERQLRAALSKGGQRRSVLRAAIVAMGMDVSDIPVAPGPVDDVMATAELAPRTSPPSPNGIGGTRRRDAIPHGQFSAAMRAKLQRAIELQRKGAEEYEKSGPDGQDRKAHRKLAHESLREARDIYQEAMDEDPNAMGLESRLTTVMSLLAQVNKDRTIDE